MSRIVIALFSFLLLVPQGLRAAGTLTTVVMSKQEPDNYCTQPPATTSFSTTDQAAWLWFVVSNVSVGDDYSVAFYTPAGANLTGAGYDFGPETAPGTYCYTVGIAIAGYTPATLTGTWNAHIYNRGSQIYLEPFTIAGSTTCSYSLTSSSASVAAAGGSGSFSVTAGSGCTWTATSTVSWITTTSTGSGGGTVNYTVTANTSTSSRTGTITVGGQTFTVTQAAAAASGTQFTYNGFASTAGLTMVGNAATVSTSDGTVLRLTPATGNQSGAAYNTTPVTLGNNATFSSQFQFRFSNQGGTEPADGIVFVLGTSTKGLGGLGVGMGYQGVSGNSVGIEFDTYNNTGFGLGNDDGNSSNHVSIDTNGNLTNTGLTNVYGNQTCIFATGSNSNTAAGCMSNGDLWTVNISYNGSNLTVTLTDPAKGSSFTAINNYPINLASLLGQNTAYAGFTSGTGAGWENHDIVNWTFANTTQSAACTYSLSASGASVGAAQTTGTVAVTAGTGCTWTATSNAPTWLTTSSAGIGNGTVSYAVTANAGTSSRTGTITVGGQTFTVTQAAAAATEIFTNFNSSACNQTGTSQFTLTNTANVTHWGVWYDWSTGQTSVAATAKQGSTTVFSGNLTRASCDPNQASWCNADAVVNATWPAGAYTVTVSPAQMCANSGSSNQGFVYIYGTWQGAGSCSYTLSPSSASIGAAQSTGSVTVTAGSGCTWTATSNAPSWLTTSSSGTGNGTVSYTVAANTSTTSRTGTITVGGQTFTVTQAAAAACSYSISPTSNNMAAQGGSSSISIVVTAGTSCAWTASVSSSASSWLHLGSVTSGTGNGSVSYSADLNTSTVSRTGTIAIANLTFTLTQAGGASATAPSIAQGGIVNAVSNRAGVIAQGSIFTIYGTNLGPAARWAAYQFPIPDTVNGVAVTVTQGSTTLKAYLLYVQAAQINAIMPSSTPLGNVQITVNYNGIPSTPTAATIVKVAFGINSTAYGPGPGIIKNYDGSTNPPLNTASIPAKPGQVEIMVGTGLGPITTPDNQSPPGGNLPVAVQVLVGGQQASVAYNGRAPGNAGQDQINFSVPANAPTGCSVPVQVNAGGTWSNTVRMAISTDGKHCQDSFSPFANLSSTGGNAGTIALIRLKFNGQSIKTGGPLNAALDLGIGAFVKNSPGGDLAYSPLTNLPPPGTCSSTITTADQGTATSNIFSFDPTITSTLDAGAQLTVTGGAGGASGTMTQSLGSANPYAGLLGGILNTSSGTTLPPPFLDGGPFTVSGPGGKDVGPFTTNIALTPAITWTNPPSTINRASPLTLTWTGGDSTEVVVIAGSSTDQTSKAYGGFTCVAPAGAHSFTVPVNTLADLIPVGVATSSTGAFGMLLLMPLEPGSMQFTPLPKGLDAGVVFDTTATMQQVQVQ
jgi:uncharacterized protein (TIGR03437 family)